MQLLFLLVYLIEAPIAFMYYYDNFKLKRGTLFTVLILLGLYGVAFVGNILDNNTNYINCIIFFAIHIVFGLVCFEMSPKSSIFHSGILLTVMATTEVIVEGGLAFIMETPILPEEVYEWNKTYFVIIAMLSKSLYLIVCKVISTLFSYKKNRVDRSTYVLFIFPIVLVVMIALMINSSAEYHFSRGRNLALSIIGVVSTLFCCFIFIYNRYIQNQQQELFALQQQSLKNEMDMQYLNLLEERNQAMQILTHDYKNHLYAIRNMSGSEQTAYIDKITDELQSSRTSCHSGNHTLDIIINKYVTECALRNVSFDFEVKLTNLSSVSDYDLVTILGNLLDNALEAAQQSAAKTITFKTNKINTYDAVIITNSCDTPPDKDLKTTKQNKKLHGVGLKSVTKALKQYGGELEWEYSEDTHTFMVTVIIINDNATVIK